MTVEKDISSRCGSYIFRMSHKVNPRYNESICSWTEYLMSRLICKKGLVLFLFPRRTYVLDIYFFKVLNTIFLHNF